MRTSNDKIWNTTDKILTFYKKKSGNWQLFTESKSGGGGGMFQPKEVLEGLAKEWGVKIEVTDG